MKNKIFSLALLLITAVSCDTTKKMNETSGNSTTSLADKEPIIQENWILIELEGQKITDDNKNPIYFTLNPDGNSINGFAGCNTFFGDYNLEEENNRIRFSKLATTRMACHENKIEESVILKVFELTNNYTIHDNLLMLNVGKRSPLAVFKKSIPEVTGKYWKLKTLEGRKIEMTPNQEREVYFILEADTDKVRGFTGCNIFNGTYTLTEGNRINFSQMATTMKACADLALNESEFLKVLELANNYTLQGDVLSLNIGKRSPLAVFEAVYF